jgi:hypothetical protein
LVHQEELDVEIKDMTDNELRKKVLEIAMENRNPDAAALQAMRARAKPYTDEVKRRITAQTGYVFKERN